MDKSEKRLIAGGAGFAVLLAAVILGAASTLHPVSLPEEAPGEGVGRTAAAEVFAAGVSAAEAEADWFRPEEAEIVWTAEPVRDIASPDWNLNTSLVGWDGRMMEQWELDLFARVFYLEFWQPNEMLCEAGCDAMLNLWASGIYGTTLFESLSYCDPEYGYTYRVYPHVWETVYDADGLAWCRAFCEDRFLNGPEWCAMYFQLGGYHDPTWAVPAYQIDNVYFSVRGW